MRNASAKPRVFSVETIEVCTHEVWLYVFLCSVTVSTVHVRGKVDSPYGGRLPLYKYVSSLQVSSLICLYNCTACATGNILLLLVLLLFM